jgi:hypothetical protein
MIRKVFWMLISLSLVLAACGTDVKAQQPDIRPCPTPTSAVVSSVETTIGSGNVEPTGNQENDYSIPQVDENARNQMMDKVNQGGPGVPVGSGQIEPPVPGSETIPGQAPQNAPATPSPTPCP